MKNLFYYLMKLKYMIFKKAKIGENFVIGKNVNIDYDFKCGNNVYIGQYSYIGPNTTIGNFCMLSDNVNIIGHDHNFEKVGIPIILAGRPDFEPKTVLHDDVWIGHGVTIMRGVEIGEGSIVGANSVVTRNIEPYSVYAGVPAKFIRKRFNNNGDRIQHAKKIKELINGETK
jgi:acetyltransferase-like isoleucine patch superfamily enzyme